MSKANIFDEGFERLRLLGEQGATRLKEQQRLQRSRTRDEQVAAGRCSVRPLPKVATQPFRSELSVEQNSLFVSNQYKGDFFERVWDVKHPGSEEPVTRRLLVGKVHSNDRARGVLTQAHQDVFYHLLQLWGQHGYKVGELDGKTYGHIKVSVYCLVTSLRGNNGAARYLRIQELLRDLVAIPIVLENEYNWQGVVDREEFSLLGEVRWNGRKLDKKTGRPHLEGVSEVSILFSSRVTEGFLHKHVKMLLGTPYRSLGSSGAGRRGEIARLLYPFLDAQLSSKDEYHVRLDALMHRFGLSRYEYKSKRREKIEPAVRMLDRKPILGERYVLRVSLREASSGDDYVLVARREQGTQLPIWKDE